MPRRIAARVVDVCRLVPLLPIVLAAAVPLALLWDWRPWGPVAPWGELVLWGMSPNPSVGQWIVIALVVYTVVSTLLGMIDDVRNGQVGIDLLAVLAMLSTLGVGEYWASWAVMLMVASGEAIEEYAQSKAERSLTALLQAAPRTAHVFDAPGMARGGDGADGSDGAAEDSPNGFRRVVPRHGSQHGSQQEPASAHAAFRTVPVDDVHVGDTIIVLPGETVPVDGTLLSGSATLDLSAINGEPLPREVFANARVMSGAVNGATALTMRATRPAADSQYQRIMSLVASAQESRPAVVRTADRLAVPFTVLALVIAGAAWAVAGVPVRFAQVLVLATPCPLLIAAPVAYVAGTGRLAKAGILIKTQSVLEQLGRVTHVFFDKTGTLTVKQPQVVRVELAAGQRLDADHVLMMAGVVEGYSVHILAQGIAKAGREAGERLRRERGAEPRAYPVVRDVREESGQGIAGEVDGRAVRVGRRAFATAAGGFRPTGAESERSRFGALGPGEMGSYVSVNGVLAARIVLRDVPRADAKATVERLSRLGVRRVTMLTGDRRASAGIIAEEVGIRDVRAELFPEDKVAAVRDESRTPAGRGTSARPTVTMMVGDGVNDAPVLAAADLGVAITDGTSTAASESAQIVIMNDDVAAVPQAIAIARRTRRVMLQAVLAGLALAVVGMLAAAFDLIPVVVGAFLQEAIDVVSILWALTALLDRE
ncbi:heavy metal translocating P-type ATPase [Bifidobacterium moraviense]|uniref:heavy metal translocating P-type ATPase n=1 Tax=Bifidobacterium moraviense TaxID=2675323 RepID=UPI002FFB3F35